MAYVLSQAADEGNVYLPRAELTSRAAELLGVSRDAGRKASARCAGASRCGWRSGRQPRRSAADRLAEERPVYLIPFYYGEVGVTNRLRRLADAPADRLARFRLQLAGGIRRVGSSAGSRIRGARVALTPQQMEAVQAALTRRVTVLTGGPGTGKTTARRSIIRLAEAAGARVALASPTGRAAKRLSETTGRPAKTIHRLLEFKPADGFMFQRNEENPLEADLVIVDEASMLDLLLTNHLLKAIPAGAHLLLVGDIDQLPSVGAGQCAARRDRGDRGQDRLRSRPGPDALHVQPAPSSASTRSSASRRAATSSPTPTASTAGEMPVLDNQNATDFFLFREEDPEKAADLVVELVAERIPRKFGLRSDEIQVLSPMHRGAVGVAALNARLQAALNPPRPGLAERQVGGRALPRRRPGDADPQQLRQGCLQRRHGADHRGMNLEDQIGHVSGWTSGTVRVRLPGAGRAGPRVRGQRAQGAGQRVSGRGHPAADHALHDAAAQPALHRGDPRPEAGGAGRFTAGHQHRCAQQPGKGTVFGPGGTIARDVGRRAMSSTLAIWKACARQLKTEVYALYLTYPRSARAVVCQGPWPVASSATPSAPST